MPYNGSGTFTVYTPGNPVVTGTAISSTAFNATMTDFATGLTNAWPRDGQAPALNNIPMATFKFTGLGAGTVAGDSVRFEQLPSSTNILPIVAGGTGAGTAATALVSLGERTGATSSLILPSGNTAQRDASPAAGYLRYNTQTVSFEGYNGTVWGAIGGGGGTSGGLNVNNGTNAAMYQNDNFIDANWTLGQDVQATCTISIASPCVITMANTFTSGQPVRFTTTGALPTGLTTGGPYYVIATGLSTSSFQVSATVGGSAINTSGSQSGTQTCGKIKNASSSGPMTIASGITVTVPSGSRWIVQ